MYGGFGGQPQYGQMPQQMMGAMGQQGLMGDQFRRQGQQSHLLGNLQTMPNFGPVGGGAYPPNPGPMPGEPGGDFINNVINDTNPNAPDYHDTGNAGYGLPHGNGNAANGEHMRPVRPQQPGGWAAPNTPEESMATYYANKWASAGRPQSELTMNPNASPTTQSAWQAAIDSAYARNPDPTAAAAAFSASHPDQAGQREAMLPGGIGLKAFLQQQAAARAAAPAPTPTRSPSSNPALNPAFAGLTPTQIFNTFGAGSLGANGTPGLRPAGYVQNPGY